MGAASSPGRREGRRQRDFFRTHFHYGRCRRARGQRQPAAALPTYFGDVEIRMIGADGHGRQRHSSLVLTPVTADGPCARFTRDGTDETLAFICITADEPRWYVIDEMPDCQDAAVAAADFFFFHHFPRPRSMSAAMAHLRRRRKGIVGLMA